MSYLWTAVCLMLFAGTIPSARLRILTQRRREQLMLGLALLGVTAAAMTLIAR
jgi:hypothetical protein